MDKQILRVLKRVGEVGVYEHKLAAQCGKDPANFTFPELDSLENNGFAKRFVKQRGAPYKGVKITAAGETELARLEQPQPRTPSPEEARRKELVAKLQDDTITDVEVRELLRLTFIFKQ